MMIARPISISMNRKIQGWQLFIKRVVDVLVSGIFLVIFGPCFGIIAILIKLTSDGPIFFRWEIIGKDARKCTGYKFRTMFVGAERMREALQVKNQMTGPFFKIKDDPRVTSIGHFLRKFSIDELPQLWSVLKGDMSLVGPRPTQVFEYERLEDWQKQRIQVRPGCTSLWIVSGKSSDFDEMVRSDLAYINNWSLWIDVKILLKTIPYAVLGRNY